MSNKPLTLFQDELNPGERILWSGQPHQGFLLRPADVFFIPFSLMLGGFSIIWFIAATSQGVSFFYLLLSIPFTLMSFYFLVGRFFFDIAQRKSTYYALTSERIIILSGLFNRNIKSLNLRTLSEINISERGNGKGTITLGYLHPALWIYTPSGIPVTRPIYQPPAFERIDNARKVYKLIKRVHRAKQ